MIAANVLIQCGDKTALLDGLQLTHYVPSAHKDRYEFIIDGFEAGSFTSLVPPFALAHVVKRIEEESVEFLDISDAAVHNPASDINRMAKELQGHNVVAPTFGKK